MNVRVPGQDDDTFFWFAAIVTAMAVIVALAFMAVRTYKMI
jgi:Mg2+ and Co2+ transporter CorA